MMFRPGNLGHLGRLGLVAAAVRQLFDPRSLFAAGEQGVWYDPSDLSTLFQDSAGTVPVTAVEQPVGRMLDKSGRGNHAFQTTAIDRPILRNRYNLLTKTEQFQTGSDWINALVTVSDNTVVAPNGSETAATVTTTGQFGGVRHQFPLTAGVAYRVKFWAKAPSGSRSYSVRHDPSSATLATITPIASWTEYSFLFTPTVSGVLFLMQDRATGPFLPFHIWGASIVQADQSALPYQRVNTATDYDSDPSKFPLYLQANGTNTWMQTNSIDFSSTDKVTVFAGLRRGSNSGDGVLFETSPSTWSSNPGSFALFGTLSSSARVGAFLRGQTLTSWQVLGLGLSNYIVSARLNLAGETRVDEITPRLNGVFTGIYGDAANAGTGNFGNHVLYLFRRGGTSYPFNGNFYGLLICGALTSDPDTLKMERWLALKTGVQL